MKGFQFRSSFKTWAYRITVNTAINRYRQSAKENNVRVDYDNMIESLPDPHSAIDEVMKMDNESRLNAALAILNPEYKVCLILREIEGLSYQEIAATLSIPVNTVRSRLKRARETLLGEARKGLVKDEL
jgi:RNA polymerase sigma-70 factor, ECF subfamily